MNCQPELIPVVLFAYSRPHHLQQTLASLRANGIPKLCVFSDGPRTPDKAPRVEQVRRMLRAIDWCDVELVERPENLGLGRSILTGMTEIFEKYEAAIIFEDDLICVPGTYQYLCAALRHYRDCPQVMSVTGWTHPRIRPASVKDQPYFDGRAECWLWGSWARAWHGMQRDALSLVADCRARGLDVRRYGADLAVMAEVEARRNLWAVRFAFLHMLHGGLCLRPPWSLVENGGFDAEATNSAEAQEWLNPPLQPCPLVPENWPEAVEHPDCSPLWQRACGHKKPVTLWAKLPRVFHKALVSFGKSFARPKQ